jgi:hypothetical protein
MKLNAQKKGDKRNTRADVVPFLSSTLSGDLHHRLVPVYVSAGQSLFPIHGFANGHSTLRSLLLPTFTHDARF